MTSPIGNVLKEKRKRSKNNCVRRKNWNPSPRSRGGIAHDYNNLLSIIMGNLGLAMQYAEPGSDLASF